MLEQPAVARIRFDDLRASGAPAIDRIDARNRLHRLRAAIAAHKKDRQ